MSDLSDRTAIDIAEEERLRVTNIQDGRLADVELLLSVRTCFIERSYHLRDMLILVVPFSVVVDDRRPHPVATHERRILLL